LFLLAGGLSPPDVSRISRRLDDALCYWLGVERSATGRIQHVAGKRYTSPGHLGPPSEMAGAVAGDYPP